MKVFLAAADRDLVSVYAQYLSSRGMQVCSACDGIQLLARLNDGEAGVCVLDEQLPLTTVSAALAALDSAGWRTILLTRGTSDQTPGRIALRYPFSPQALLDALMQTGKGIDNGQGS